MYVCYRCVMFSYLWIELPKFILLHSQSRKKESKIAVAKRQRKEKACKDRTKKSEDQSENLRWSQPSWLA